MSSHLFLKKIIILFTLNFEFTVKFLLANRKDNTNTCTIYFIFLKKLVRLAVKHDQLPSDITNSIKLYI